jgi:hypothetical protein
MRLYTIYIIAIKFFSIPVSAQNYTMPVPSDIDSEWGLCTFEIMSYANNSTAAVALAEIEEEYSGIKTLTSLNGYTVTWHPIPSGGGEITVDSNNFKNQFWIKLGFCYWTEDRSEKLYKEIQGDLVGGSIDEEDLEGPYDGLCSVFFELCGEDMDYSEVERILLEAEKSLPLESLYELRGFDLDSNKKQAVIYIDLVNYEVSHRKVVEQFLDALKPKHSNIRITFGNRLLILSDCYQPGFWYRVLKTENAEEWGELYTGSRVFAIPRDDGNIMVSYTAAINNGLLNIFGIDDLPKKLNIGAVPESGSPNYWLSNFLIITRGEGMEVTDIVRSVSGKLTLTEDRDTNTFSGSFEVVGIDQLGRTRSVIGGFRDLTFPK